jgi:hypothetical protein
MHRGLGRDRGSRRRLLLDRAGHVLEIALKRRNARHQAVTVGGQSADGFRQLVWGFVRLGLARGELNGGGWNLQRRCRGRQCLMFRGHAGGQHRQHQSGGGHASPGREAQQRPQIEGLGLY